MFSGGRPDASLEAVARTAGVGIASLYRHHWMWSNVKFVATKKGMSTALALATYKNSKLFSHSSDRLTRAAGGLLDRAIVSGDIRHAISPEDLLRALVGMCYMPTISQAGRQAFCD